MSCENTLAVPVFVNSNLGLVIKVMYLEILMYVGFVPVLACGPEFIFLTIVFLRL